MKLTIKYTGLLLAAALTFSACEKLEDVNKNPNEPEAVDAGVLFTSSIRSSLTTSVNQSYLLGNCAAQLAAKTVRTEIDAYNWNSFTNVWEGYYNSLSNLIEAEVAAKEAGNEAMQGAIKVMKSWMFSQLTLAYGDIPYTEAIQGASDQNWFPKYDSQEDILIGDAGLIKELESATALLSGSGSIEGDILYYGDATAWTKFANSLKLRLLMYVSNSVDVTTEIDACISAGNLFESNADNAALVFTGNFPNEFPLVPMKEGDFDAVNLGIRAFEAMSEQKDPRLMEYARPKNVEAMMASDTVKAVYGGAVNGSENTDVCPKDGSRLGLRYYNYPGHPMADAMANGIIMTYAEVEFLIAEAAQKGISSEDAEAHYKSGIQASIEQYTMDYDAMGWNDFNDFYTNATGVSYDGTLASLWKQKWLSMFFSGLDPYFELRRWLHESDYVWADLGFVTAPCENTNNDMLPMRFIYPGNESSLNPDHYKDAVSKLNEGNTQNSKIWVVSK